MVWVSIPDIGAEDPLGCSGTREARQAFGFGCWGLGAQGLGFTVYSMGLTEGCC